MVVVISRTGNRSRSFTSCFCCANYEIAISTWGDTMLQNAQKNRKKLLVFNKKVLKSREGLCIMKVSYNSVGDKEEENLIVAKEVVSWTKGSKIDARSCT